MPIHQADNSDLSVEPADLSDQELPNAQELRDIRLRILAELTEDLGDKIPKKLQERLEREPLVFSRNGSGEREWSGQDYSLASLYFQPKAFKPDWTPTGLAKITRVAIYRALKTLPFGNEEKKAILTLWNQNSYFAGKLTEIIGKLIDPEQKIDWERERPQLFMGRVFVVLLRTAYEMRERTNEDTLEQKALLFLRTLEQHSRPFFEPITMAHDTSMEVPVIQVEPGFQKFCASLPSSDLAKFIEQQDLVQRPSSHGILPIIKERSNLIHYRYDITRVREFELVAAGGERLSVVSKRVSPRKSAYADQEFEVSKQVHNWGIPTPDPVAEINEGENRYFLWKKLEAIDPEQSDLESFKRQKRDIIRRLQKRGVKHQDPEDRNFITTRDGEGILVHIIDFERCSLI